MVIIAQLIVPLNFLLNCSCRPQLALHYQLMYVTYTYTKQLDLVESHVRKYIMISLKCPKCYKIFAVVHSFCSAYKTFFYSDCEPLSRKKPPIYKPT